MLPIQDHPSGLSFRIRVQPKSSRNEIVSAQGDALKLKVTAPPVEGAANKACIEMLAKALGVPKSCLKINSGQASRTKTMFVRCTPAAATRIRQSLQGLCAANDCKRA
jgi:uncharacterized protein (TIGR00251 family)